MQGVCSELKVVGSSEIQGACGCATAVYHSPKARVCRLLFGPLPPGLDEDAQLPDIGIYRSGVEREGAETFVVETEEGDEAPRKSDVIEVDGFFFVIGEVHTVEDPYLEIEPEVLWVYPDLESTNDVYSNTLWQVK